MVGVEAIGYSEDMVEEALKRFIPKVVEFDNLENFKKWVESYMVESVEEAYALGYVVGSVITCEQYEKTLALYNSVVLVKETLGENIAEKLATKIFDLNNEEVNRIFGKMVVIATNSEDAEDFIQRSLRIFGERLRNDKKYAYSLGYVMGMMKTLISPIATNKTYEIVRVVKVALGDEAVRNLIEYFLKETRKLEKSLLDDISFK